MSVPFEAQTHTIWDFALAIYHLPQMESDFLTAQNEFGLDVNTLIFALYRAQNSMGFDPEAARALAEIVSVQVTEPLRGVRNALKTPPAFLDPGGAQALRQHVKSAELEAERLTLLALNNLPDDGPILDAEAALFTIAQTKIHSRRHELESLLKRLANVAQCV
jgi:uncharacterized protein (TIGR02444 family)